MEYTMEQVFADLEKTELEKRFSILKSSLQNLAREAIENFDNGDLDEVREFLVELSGDSEG